MDFLESMEREGFNLVTVDAEDGESQMDNRSLTLTYTADIKITFGKIDTDAVQMDDALPEEPDEPTS
jgi:hypothetical protein